MRIIKIAFLSISFLLFGLLNATATKQPIQLEIKKYPISVNGKPTELIRIEQPDGTWGFNGEKGQLFDAVVTNNLDKPTVIHWHGLILPNNQDGVPYVTQPPILPKGTYHYRFKLIQAGTFWMHSHFDLQEQKFLSAPFIIKDPQEHLADNEVIMMLGDFSFKEPEEILSSLRASNKIKMDMPSGQMQMSMPTKQKKGTEPKDLVDVNYDAFLTNYKTLKDPEIIPVLAGQKIRLRVIAGSAMTNFIIHTGKLEGEAVAVDGENIYPFYSKQFQLAVGQRIDIIVTIPKGEGAYPIVAQGEGTKMQTGLILATKNAKIDLPSEQTANTAEALNYDQEFKFKSKTPLKPQQPGQTLTVTLDGSMATYSWKFNKQAWPFITPIQIKPNKRIEMVIVNNTMMSHPVHLHGHTFQVTEIDGKPIQQGAKRDTVLVLPKSTVKIQFDSNHPGNWMMHCHMLYHMASGMMSFVNYEGVPVPDLKSIQKGEATH